MTALGLVEDIEACDRIQRTVITLANKIIVADDLDVQSSEDTQRAFKKASGCISIALESLSTGTIRTAQACLEQVHAETLFRAGISIIMKVRKEFFATAWHISDRVLLQSFMGSPLGETLHGLSMQRPMLYEGLLSSGGVQFRAFMTLQEVQEARKALIMCRDIDSLLFSQWSIDPGWIMTGFVSTTTLSEPAQLRAEAVFLTVLARYILTGKTRLEALLEAETRQFLDAAFEQKADGGFCLKSSLRNDTLAWLASFYDGVVPPALESFSQVHS